MICLDLVENEGDFSSTLRVPYMKKRVAFPKVTDGLRTLGVFPLMFW